MARPGLPGRTVTRVVAVGVVLAVVLALTGILLTRGGGDPATGAATTPSTTTSADRPDPATDPAFARFYEQELDWSGCGDGFECAKAVVPLDWEQPDGETIELAMIRKPATGTRIGSLFRNPGGPGASGVDYLRTAVAGDPAALTATFDMVSWDTRGTGGSDPLTCLPDAQLDAYYAADATPDTPAEERALVAGVEDYVEACEANSGPLLEHVDTISTVKDMDVMRAAVGDEVLSYIGASYGTFLGAWYAEEFPWRAGRLVLDGAVDPALTAAEYAQGQAMGFSRAVEAYLGDCLDRRECPLRGSEKDAVAQLQRLLDRADANPLPTGSRPLTQALMQYGIVVGMYSRESWPYLTQALTAALQGDGSGLLALADLYLERAEDGTYGQIQQVINPIYCLDHADRRDVDEIRASAEELRTEYPPFGDFIGWGESTCAEWPYRAVVPRQELTAPGAAPILVLGTTGDPATPYEWAESLAGQLTSGVLVTREGEGHTAYAVGSACIDRTVVDYLVRGTVPPEGTRCR